MVEQANYTNLFLQTVSSQLSHIEKSINNQDLRCPTLSHFKWYKDAFFFAKVLSREHCNGDFWKEKFISNFSTLFADKNHGRLRSKEGGIIPYNMYTSRKLAVKIVAKGLALCNDLKLAPIRKGKNLKQKSSRWFLLTIWLQWYFEKLFSKEIKIIQKGMA